MRRREVEISIPFPLTDCWLHGPNLHGRGTWVELQFQVFVFRIPCFFFSLGAPGIRIIDRIVQWVRMWWYSTCHNDAEFRVSRWICVELSGPRIGCPTHDPPYPLGAFSGSPADVRVDRAGRVGALVVPAGPDRYASTPWLLLRPTCLSPTNSPTILRQLRYCPLPSSLSPLLKFSFCPCSSVQI